MTVTDAPAEHEVTERTWREFVTDGHIGVDYEFQMVPFGDLVVDYHESVLDDDELPEGVKSLAYQRRQDKYAKKMASEGFRSDLFGALIVNKRTDGSFAVVDGGTRYRFLAGIELPDEVEVPCLVFKWDDQREIGNYIALNRERSGLTQVDFFVAKVKFGHPEAVAIDVILQEQTGHTIHVRKGGWQAVNAIEVAYRRGNLEETMGLIRQLGWMDRPRGRTQAIITAVSKIVANDNFNAERALVAWKGVTPVELYGISEDMKKANLVPGQSRTLANLVGLALLGRYNHKLAQRKKIGNEMFIPRLTDFGLTDNGD
jgi:hypothetical protein